MCIEEIGVDVYEGYIGCGCRPLAHMDEALLRMNMALLRMNMALLWMNMALLRMNRAFVCRYTALWQKYGSLLWRYLDLLRMNQAFVRICIGVVARSNEEIAVVESVDVQDGRGHRSRLPQNVCTLCIE